MKFYVILYKDIKNTLSLSNNFKGAYIISKAISIRSKYPNHVYMSIGDYFDKLEEIKHKKESGSINLVAG